MLLRESSHDECSSTAASSNTAAGTDDSDPTFSDVFGSPHVTAVDRAERHEDQDPNHPASEPSELPRLRQIHVTAGYRDGAAEGQAAEVQAGFDEGYGVGARVGWWAGWCLGKLRGVMALFAQIRDTDGVSKMRELVEGAERELKQEVLFGPEWVGKNGEWLFKVKIEEERDGVVVAAGHPVVNKWWRLAVEAAEGIS